MSGEHRLNVESNPVRIENVMWVNFNTCLYLLEDALSRSKQVTFEDKICNIPHFAFVSDSYKHALTRHRKLACE